MAQAAVMTAARRPVMPSPVASLDRADACVAGSARWRDLVELERESPSGRGCTWNSVMMMASQRRRS